MRYFIFVIVATLSIASKAEDANFYMEFDRIVSDDIYVSEYKAGISFTTSNSASVVNASIGYRVYDLYLPQDAINIATIENDFSGGTFNFAVELSGKGDLKPFIGIGVEIKENDFKDNAAEISLSAIGIETSDNKNNCSYYGDSCYEEEDEVYFNASLGLRVDIIENLYGKVFYQYNYIGDFSDDFRHINLVGFALGLNF